MLRSLFSGIAGLKTQQIKMDVIGNNISNVSTYGYKSARATFKDVYYQTSATATAANGNTGGTNSVQIGYGNTLGSIDVNTATSAMSSTGYSLDVAIAGEGYLQVMNPEGKISYTKAGMLDIDADGNLVDINGNFILGVSGDTSQEPSSNRIQVDLPYLDPTAAKASDTINDIGYSITATNPTEQSNVNISFVSSESLPIGQPMSAKVSGSSIVVTLNAREKFAGGAAGLDAFNQMMNEEITAANGGVEHNAGAFTLDMDDISAFKDDITGADIVSTNFGYHSGTVKVPSDLKSLFDIKGVNDGFSGVSTTNDMTVAYDTTAKTLTVTMGDYTATINESQLASAGTVLMTRNPNTDRTDSFVMSYPSLTTLKSNILSGTASYTSTSADGTMVSSKPTDSLGLGASPFKLKGGTEGGEQTVANLTSISISDDGSITGTHDIYGLVELGRIDLATFSNPAGLAKVGNTYFETTLNSGDPIITQSGSNGTGALVASTLESSNVDLSNEFSDMIMTQRGFQASSRVITVSDTMLEELINLKR